MDALKNALSGNKSEQQPSTNTQQQSTSTGTNTSGQGQQDYGDKAFKTANDKAGWGLDDSKREKLSDFGRSAYEKASGSKVDPKYSN